MSKKLEQKQARRLEQERRQSEQRKAALRRNLVTIIVAVVVLAAVAFAILSERQATEVAVGVPLAEARCGEVQEVDALEGAHIKEGAPHDQYNSNPPTSGPHYEIPADPAFYSDPVEPERLIHNLEHGQIVLWYSPEASEEEKKWLEEIQSDEPIATVVSPYNVENGVVTLTAWLAGEDEDEAGTGVLQSCAEVSQAAIDEFRKKYQGRSPEPLTPRFKG